MEVARRPSTTGMWENVCTEDLTKCYWIWESTYTLAGSPSPSPPSRLALRVALASESPSPSVSSATRSSRLALRIVGDLVSRVASPSGRHSGSSPSPHRHCKHGPVPQESTVTVPASDSSRCIEPSSSVGILNCQYVPAWLQPLARAFCLKNATTTTRLQVIATSDQGLFVTPRDLHWHPLHPRELWVANSGTADISIKILRR